MDIEKKPLSGKLASVTPLAPAFSIFVADSNDYKVNKCLNSPLCFLDSSDILGIEPFRFEMREEALHGGIVVTVASIIMEETLTTNNPALERS